MGRRVDAAGKPRDDDPAEPAQLPRDGFGEQAAIGRGVAGADHGYGAPAEQAGVAQRAQQRRSALGRGQQGRVGGIGLRDQPAPQPGKLGELALGGRSRADSQGPLAPAAARQLGQRVQRRFGAAEGLQQMAKGLRTDALAAAEPQPSRAFVLIQPLAHRAEHGKSGKVCQFDYYKL